MLDFTAFPIRRVNRYFWIKIPAGLVVLSLLTSFVLISRPSVSEKELGLAIFQITGFVIVGVLSISLLVISIWFTKYIVTRFIRVATDGYSEPAPLYDNISSFEKFAIDNGYEYIKYNPQTIAPQDLYAGMYEKAKLDDVYILYQIKGVYERKDFNLYCLAIAEGSWPGRSERRGMAYAHDIDGRRLEYVTVLSTPSHVPRKRFGVIRVLSNIDRSVIFVNGYISDRNTLKKMFDLLTQ
jgi:hypothetical protein